MNSLSIVQDGRSMPTPAWANTLAQIGNFMDVARSSDQLGPTVVAVCLPRVDYAAFFVSIGIMLGAPQGIPSRPASEIDRLTKILGTVVAYRKNEKTHLGVLESISDTEKTATIVELSGISPKTKTQSRWIIQVRQCDWSKIHASATSFDLERGATKRQIGKAATQHSHNITIASVFSEEVAARFASSNKPLAAAYVEKQRFFEECSSTRLATENGTISAGDALNTESQREGAGMQICTAGSGITEEATDLVIIEAGRRLGDQLAQLARRRAIVLLARNRAGYKESAAQLLSYLSHRGEYPQPMLGVSLPAYMKVILVK